MGKIEYSVEAFANTLKSSFIDSAVESDQRYAPKIVSNGKQSGLDVLSVIKKELSGCKSFDFSVAFVTSSGIQVLVQILNELCVRGVSGRVLTSTLNNFNDPDALRKLLEFPNIETRVFQGNLHAKGYVFGGEQISTIVIGSSNLTHQALTCNKEWNVLFRTFSNGGLLRQMRAEYDEVWEDEKTTAVTSSWIDEYEDYRHSVVKDSVSLKKLKPPFCREEIASECIDSCGTASAIVPNRMQSLALESLRVLHDRREKRALLVSATGTGKTYLSALDVRRVEPGRVLFIAHRHRILEASRASFERVLGTRYSYDILKGGAGDSGATCVFAMVETLRRRAGEFDPYAFDYIIIDEAHRVGARGYREILDYFKPGFCLGMTATPLRTDGFDVYSLFNHVVAFRITLQDALEEDMLAPFHYFGIADLEIDDEAVDDVGDFTKLSSEERVKHITSKIEQYSVEKRNRRGLIFCNRNEEAVALSAMFNDRGYRTVSISGETSDDERNKQIARLESGELEYIFSVDILNEGVDIPSLNQVVMLRRTDSPIVFVQQLGRGLRKNPGKEYVLVLDFIGNYRQNYLIPIALSGDRTYNKDTLRRIVKEGNTVVPGCSTISFDRVSEGRIFRSLEENSFTSAKLIKDEYRELKRILGRIPDLLDFDANESIDPSIIFSKYGSYAAFLQSNEPEVCFRFNERKLSLLRFLSTKIANGKRKEDLLVLSRLLSSFRVGFRSGLPSDRSDKERSRAVSLVLSGEFSTRGEVLVEDNGSSWTLSAELCRELEDSFFFEQFKQTVDFGLSRSEKFYSVRYKDTDFVLYAKYSREEVCRLLRWEKEPNYQNVGGYFYDKKTKTFPVFIDYEKDPSISVTTQYEDRFLSDRVLVAISKNNRNINSPEIERLKRADENEMRCFLFLRKNKKDKDMGTEFYFLGEMRPTGQFDEIVMKDLVTTAVEITYQLDEPVRADLYDYFLSDFKELG